MLGNNNEMLFFLLFYMFILIVLLRQPVSFQATIGIVCLAFEPLFQVGIVLGMMEEAWRGVSSARLSAA